MIFRFPPLPLFSMEADQGLCCKYNDNISARSKYVRPACLPEKCGPAGVAGRSGVIAKASGGTRRNRGKLPPFADGSSGLREASAIGGWSPRAAGGFCNLRMVLADCGRILQFADGPRGLREVSAICGRLSRVAGGFCNLRTVPAGCGRLLQFADGSRGLREAFTICRWSSRTAGGFYKR